MAGLTVKQAMDKIDQVKDELSTRIDNLDKDLNDKFTKLVDELKQVLSEMENTDNIDSESNAVEGKESVDKIALLEAKIADLEEGLNHHVIVYNNHIIQQHGKTKG